MYICIHGFCQDQKKSLVALGLHPASVAATGGLLVYEHVTNASLLLLRQNDHAVLATIGASSITDRKDTPMCCVVSGYWIIAYGRRLIVKCLNTMQTHIDKNVFQPPLSKVYFSPGEDLHGGGTVFFLDGDQHVGSWSTQCVNRFERVASSGPCDLDDAHRLPMTLQPYPETYPQPFDEYRCKGSFSCDGPAMLQSNLNGFMKGTPIHVANGICFPGGLFEQEKKPTTDFRTDTDTGFDELMSTIRTLGSFCQPTDHQLRIWADYGLRLKPSFHHVHGHFVISRGNMLAVGSMFLREWRYIKVHQASDENIHIVARYPHAIIVASRVGTYHIIAIDDNPKLDVVRTIQTSGAQNGQPIIDVTYSGHALTADGDVLYWDNHAEDMRRTDIRFDKRVQFITTVTLHGQTVVVGISADAKVAHIATCDNGNVQSNPIEPSCDGATVVDLINDNVHPPPPPPCFCLLMYRM